MRPPPVCWEGRRPMKKTRRGRGKPDGKPPKYRRPEYEMLSDVTAGRVQTGPHSTPPREGTDLDEWQDPELFHSPEL